jgi:hypothetical protein
MLHPNITDAVLQIVAANVGALLLGAGLLALVAWKIR